MVIISTQKYFRMSPKKLRLVSGQIRKMSPQRALEVLPFIMKGASEPLSKVIKSAIANAKVKGFSENDLFFKEIQINEGPRLKRGQPVSRGRWHPFKKRMSHIRVVLDSKVPLVLKEAKEKIESEKKEKKQNGTKS